MKFLSGLNLSSPTKDRAALADLKQEEGSNIIDGWHVPYKCSEGYLTAGYGRNLETARFSEAEAERWLQEDYANAVRQAERIPEYRSQSRNRKRILAAMTYQIGYAGVMKFVDMRAALACADYERAAIEMLKSKWAAQTPGRARRMSVRMRNDSWPEHGS